MLAGDEDELLAPLGAAATPELVALRRWALTLLRATTESRRFPVATILPVPLIVR